MADTVKHNLRRTERKFALRKKYVDGKKLTESTDGKIWKYAFKYAQSDLST